MNKNQALTIEKPKREQIIEQAYSIFYKNGFHASGMDLILEGTGISKRTLYKYFDSKEDLIAETINYYSDLSMDEHYSKILNSQFSPDEKVLRLFTWLGDLIKSGHCIGCYAVNAKLEYADKNPKIEEACGNFFDRTEEMFYSLCKNRKKAKQISIIFRGVAVTGQHSRSAETANVAKEVIQLIMGHNT